MNSGCYEDDISKTLLSIRAIDKKKLTEVNLKIEDIKFFYRGSNISEDLLILSVKLKGRLRAKEEIELKQLDLIKRKKLAQPSQIKTCGSTFKNISKDKKAWMLIKEAECENLKVGDAVISKTFKFFVNNGNAKSSDIENLIKRVKKRVLEKTGVNLELEIKIVGE